MTSLPNQSQTTQSDDPDKSIDQLNQAPKSSSSPAFIEVLSNLVNETDVIQIVDSQRNMYDIKHQLLFDISITLNFNQ